LSLHSYVHKYTCLRLFSGLTMDCYTRHLLPCILSVIGCVFRLGVCVAVVIGRDADPTDLYIAISNALNCGFMMALILQMCGNIPNKSEQVILNIKQNAYVLKQPEYIAQAKSLVRFGVRSHPIRMITYETSSTYFESLLNYLVTILITFHN